jgi:hypothetical protein
VPAFAQSDGGKTSATAATTVRIVNVPAITNVTELNFGEILRPDTPVTATVGADGSHVSPDGAEWYNPSVSAALFKVEGLANTTIYVTLPESAFNVTHQDGDETMSVGVFTAKDRDGASFVSGGSVIFDNAGGQEISVGATLSIAENQAIGTYSNTGDLTVTIRY